MEPTAYHQIGKFIVNFQHVEAAINEILVLLCPAEDEEAVRILVNELGYSQRLKTADVLLARFVNLQREPDLSVKTAFHKLMEDLRKLGERRNTLVHSKYVSWRNVEGIDGFIRQNSRLRPREGIRQEEEEELLPKAFSEDFEHLAKAGREIEVFRLKILDWLHPDVRS